MNGATSPSGGRHPGQVVFDDKVEGTSKSTPAADLPQTIAWAEDERGEWVPVARIETTGTKSRREITRFGADGSFLDSTVQAPPPPPPRRPNPRQDDDLPQAR